MKDSQGHEAEQALQVVRAPVEAAPLAAGAGLGGGLPLEQVEHDAAQDGEVLGAVADVDPTVILAEYDIEHPVGLVLDVPVLADACRRPI